MHSYYLRVAPAGNGVAVLPLSMWSCFSATVWPPVSLGCVFRFAFALCCRFAFRMCSWPLRNKACSRLEFILSPYLFWAGARPGQAPLFLFEILLYPLHLLLFFYQILCIAYGHGWPRARRFLQNLLARLRIYRRKSDRKIM